MDAPNPQTWRFSWRGLAELGRVSNLPTCFSNVLVGCALAGGLPEPLTLTLLIGSIAALYLGGMALNDVLDAPVDFAAAPHRPIVAGRIGFRAAVAFTALTLAAGIFLARPLGVPAFTSATALLIAIILYDLTHKHWIGAVALMGACRALVYLVAAFAAGGALDAALCGYALSLAAYTTLVTLIAREERDSDAGARTGTALWLAPAALLWPLLSAPTDIWLWLAALVTLAWILRGVAFVRTTPPRTVPAILTWLAGIALLDTCYLVALHAYELAAVALLCFIITVSAHRRILGT